MSSKARMIGLGLVSGFFVCVDQYLKNLALQHQELRVYLLKPYLGWEFFKNSGVAFSLPIPQFVVLFVTPIVLLGLTLLFIRHRTSNTVLSAGLLFIMSGAISNYIDRVLYGATIDYVRVLTGVINIADVLITVGFLLLLFAEYAKNKPSSV